jgi:hypothetical protein
MDSQNLVSLDVVTLISQLRGYEFVEFDGSDCKLLLAYMK